MWDGSNPSSLHAAMSGCKISERANFDARDIFSPGVSPDGRRRDTISPVSAMTLTFSLSSTVKCLVLSPSAELADRKPLTIVVCMFIYNLFFHWRSVT